MTLAYWCVLLTILLPYAFTITAKIKGRFRPRDNRNPRDFLDQLDGVAKRAHWAQLNTFESVPGFAAAVIIAHLSHGTQGTIDSLAVAFVVIRIGFGLAYIADMPRLRSALWFAGLACVIGLFFTGV